MSMYRQHILELYKHPLNQGHVQNPTHSAEKKNESCGDKISIELEIDNDNKVADVKFQGEGCAISQAAASLLTDHIKGMTLDEVKVIDGPEMLSILGIEVSAMRLKCAMLALETVKEAVK